MELSGLKGIGTAREKQLHAMGIDSLRDLLYYLPYRYEDQKSIYPCKTDMECPVAIEGIIADEPKVVHFRNLNRISATFEDRSGKISVVWFQEPWLKNIIKKGRLICLYGKINEKNRVRSMSNPRIVKEKAIIPVYHLASGMKAGVFRNIIRSAFDMMDEIESEAFPNAVEEKYGLLKLPDAIREIHFPSDFQQLVYARKTIQFRKGFFYLLYIHLIKEEQKPSSPFHLVDQVLQDYQNSLPFALTKSQITALEDIRKDMSGHFAMRRLLQGDVGSGKTAVAFGSIYMAWRAGFQSCMMAPTEILALQHFSAANTALESLGMKCAVLTGHMGKKERESVLSGLLSGDIAAVFGTHALLNADVRFDALGLVITDEQHRFGVEQRAKLQKMNANGRYPHMLVMSATPIPRTLAFILYGDLELSELRELPPGRKKVRTHIVPGEKRSSMYEFIRKQASAGKQAFIVCPLVEDSEVMENLKSAKSVYRELIKNELADVSCGLIWGSQNQEEKTRILAQFMQGEIQVLISTTVIEVGINNPNASFMIIEGAERFGLSQLHQLRGRVGRGNEEAWCFLVTDHPERIKIMCETNDGFLISQRDLELRGPGNLFGLQQSGSDGFLTEITNAEMLKEISDAVKNLLHQPDSQEKNKVLTETRKRFDSERNIVEIH